MQATIRRAVPNDAPDLARLRASMFADMGEDVGEHDADWRADAEAWFVAFLQSDDGIVVVADLPGAGVVACALGQLEFRAPSPQNRSGLVGHVSQVSTLADHRRNGYARACLTSVLGWFDRTGVRRVDLNATGSGEGLYRDLGFADAPFAAMRRAAG